MNELDKKYQYGWYGTCENECNPFYFKDLAENRKYLDAVIRVAPGDGMSFEKFTAYDPDNEDTCPWVKNLGANETFDQYINPQFTHMDCGQAYLVAKSASYANENVTIQNFTIADFDGTSGGFVAIDGCPVPTPTPTPIPADININAVNLEYNHDNKTGDDVKAIIEISLNNSDTWQWNIDSDPTNWNVVRPVNGVVQLNDELILNPGTYTITVQGLDENENFSNHPNSQDTRTFTIDVPTPTPTPVATPTPTPTPTETPTETPTPTPTPVNCNCGSDELERTIITSTPQEEVRSWTTSTFNGFDTSGIVEVGLNESEFENTSPDYTFVTLRKSDNSLVGIVALSGVQPKSSGASIYVKIEDDCFVANISKDQAFLGEFVMESVALPSECGGCCGEMSESFVVSNGTGQSSDNLVSAIASGSNGTLCYNPASSAPNTGVSTYNCALLDNPSDPNDSTTQDLIIQISNATLNDTLFIYNTDNGCYQGNLVDTNQTAVFQRIS